MCQLQVFFQLCGIGKLMPTVLARKRTLTEVFGTQMFEQRGLRLVVGATELADVKQP